MEPLIWILALVFAVSFLSNVSPFVGASYTLFAALYLALIGPTPANFVAVVIVSAIGATMAKMVIYFGAFGFKGLLLKNKNVRLIGRNSSTDTFYLALFVTALLPVFPFDDYIYIGAGAVSARLRLMLGVTLFAKILKSGVEIALEYTILRGISQLLGIHRLDLTLLLTATFIIIGIVVYKVDWEAGYARLTGKGWSTTSPAPPAVLAKPHWRSRGLRPLTP
ncbi:MAG TPA: hypothetical protein VEJ19_00855 [Nitrososphaerales archaeon]|nr:hypothetical protein [Nitrososphaerales archaeon]